MSESIRLRLFYVENSGFQIIKDNMECLCFGSDVSFQLLFKILLRIPAQLITEIRVCDGDHGIRSFF